MKNLLLLVLSMAAFAREATAQDAECVSERAAMVETIRAYTRSGASGLGQQGLSERVLEAMGQTKRHLFIPERSCSIAYANSPIPIGHGQTISQPFNSDISHSPRIARDLLLLRMRPPDPHGEDRGNAARPEP